MFRLGKRIVLPFHDVVAGSFSIDRSAFPKVMVRYVGAISDDAFRAHLADFSALLAGGKRYGVVFDATSAERPSAVQRRMQSDWIERNKSDIRAMCVGGAFAITSPFVRGAMQAILWVSPMPFEHVLFATVPEAEEWVDGALARRGLR